MLTNQRIVQREEDNLLIARLTSSEDRLYFFARINSNGLSTAQRALLKMKLDEQDELRNDPLKERETITDEGTPMIMKKEATTFPDLTPEWRKRQRTEWQEEANAKLYAANLKAYNKSLKQSKRIGMLKRLAVCAMLGSIAFGFSYLTASYLQHVRQELMVESKIK